MPRNLRQVEQLNFTVERLDSVVAYMDRLVDAGDGWVNLVPVADGHDERPTSLRFMTLLSGGGSGTTMITWVPGRPDRRAAGQSLGISHVTGRRAVATLAAAEVSLPETWRIEQDHPKRGLIVRPPADEVTALVVKWALGAVGVLVSPARFASWRADVYLPEA